VPGHQGQRQDQLVLDQCLQVQFPRQGQHVLVGLFVLAGRLVFAHDETEVPVDRQRDHDRAQTALTLHLKAGLGLEMQPRLWHGARRFGQTPGHLPSNLPPSLPGGRLVGRPRHRGSRLRMRNGPHLPAVDGSGRPGEAVQFLKWPLT
jgi:hypothetical protein